MLYLRKIRFIVQSFARFIQIIKTYITTFNTTITFDKFFCILPYTYVIHRCGCVMLHVLYLRDINGEEWRNEVQ